MPQPRSTPEAKRLDVFTYQGGFALHLARVCDKVTGGGQFASALEAADQNAGFLNGWDLSNGSRPNAFDLLRTTRDAGRAYDTIILDPASLCQVASEFGKPPFVVQGTQPSRAEDAKGREASSSLAPVRTT
jgi:23S rRNA G2069 N7-methylase RlmK/C1962 C5-methylase RlmI